MVASSTVKSSSVNAGVEKSITTDIEPEALEPVTVRSLVPRYSISDRILLANIQISNVPTKTEDGGSGHSSANTTGRDAFMEYSNDIARRAAILDQAANAAEEGRGDVDQEINRPIRRRTRLSYELHPDQFYQDIMM